ncbi:LysR family transcriptional regulator [Roseomonas sp. GC11]|uniref:LysR family transcriptional regulator n=1 Tax=Roseomonas sp. GC11 TaxID=2950546 RepID=UPI00210D44AA|nr:LysR family transcriptional regulator [Roseomonas sp. GC11]MCQ4158665.1 LysR family transcriptional regulator [Roseomonas sp. GC11]
MIAKPEWLRSFATTAELGSFTRAAQRLDLTQAAVSQHIRALEARFGPLLIRRPRQVEVTPAGRALLGYCAEVDRAARCLAARLAGQEERRGEIGLITPGSVGLFLYPLLLDLQQAQRGLVVRHRFAPDAEVIEAVLDSRYELGLTARRPDDPRLEVAAFAQEPLELVVPAGEAVTGWADLQRLGFIDHPDGQAMANRLFSQRFGRHPGVQALPCHGFSNQVSLLLEPVARGLGFTVLPRYARRAFPRPEAVRVVEEGAPVVDTLWLIHRAEWPVSARARYVLGHLAAWMGCAWTAAPAPEAAGGGRGP